MEQQIKFLVRQFDFLSKKTNERLKIMEIVVCHVIESEINKRLDAEEKLSKKYEKISSSIPRDGGEFDDLLGALKIDLSQRGLQYQSFKQSLNTDIEIIQQKIKNAGIQIKPLNIEIEKIDKELRISNEKLDRAQEKYMKMSKEYEEIILAIQAADWNREQSNDSKEKLNQRFTSLNSLKPDWEQNYQLALQTYNTSIQNAKNTLLTFTNQLKDIYTQLFDEFKELIMKKLVYEISRQRNVQYDTEQFFKEVEKYTQPLEFSIVPEEYKLQQISLYSGKQDMVLRNFTPYSSYITDMSKRIQETNRFLMKSRSTQPNNSDPKDDEFNNYYEDIIQTMMRKAFNKPELQVQESDIKQIDEQPLLVDEQQQVVSRKEEVIEVKDPLAKPKIKQPIKSEDTSKDKKIPKPTKPVRLTVEQFTLKFSDRDPIQKIDLVSFVLGQSGADNAQKSLLSVDSFSQMMLLEDNREAFLLILEQYQPSGCQCLPNRGYKSMIRLSELILSNIKQDLKQMKRFLLCLFSIFKIVESQKIYLSETVTSNEIWDRIDLWTGLIFMNVQEELSKIELQQYDKDTNLKEKGQIFQSLLTIIQDMLRMKMDKNKIKQIIMKISQLFGLFEIQIQDLLNIVDRDGKLENGRAFNSTSIINSLISKQQEKPNKVLQFQRTASLLVTHESKQQIDNRQSLSQTEAKQQSQQHSEYEQQQSESKLQQSEPKLTQQSDDPLGVTKKYRQHPLERKK